MKRSEFSALFHGLFVETLEDRNLLATFTVNSTAALSDSFDGDGICDTANDPTADPPIPPSGICTLPAAIEQANATPGADAVAFGIPGAGPHTISLSRSLVAATAPIIVDGTTQRGFAGSPIVELDGGDAPFPINGVTISGSSVVKGLAINRFANAGILVTGQNNRIEGNYIGVDVTGSVSRGNGTDPTGLGGIVLVGSSNNVIGGTTAAARNVISGNGNAGVLIQGGSDNLVQGNYMGTDATGTFTDADGVADSGDELRNTIGVAIVSTFNGPASRNMIGGVTPEARNVIAGSEFNHVRIIGAPFNGASDARENVVQGNYLGTDKLGTTSLGSGFSALFIADASDNVVGGTAGTSMNGPCTGACNLISGSGGNGVLIEAFANASGNSIVGNAIGANVNGEASLGNVEDGVLIRNASVNTIGGSMPEDRNVIAGNGSNGVQIEGDRAERNSIRNNSIHANGSIGIDLGGDGVTPNDPLDEDSSANHRQNFPLISLIEHDDDVIERGTTIVGGTLSGTPSSRYEIDFYATDVSEATRLEDAVQGARFFGSTVVITDDTGYVHFEVELDAVRLNHERLTATATDPDGNTSEFSPFTPDLEMPNIRTPVIVVPGIFGTFPKPGGTNDGHYVDWLLRRGIHPDFLQLDPLANVYDDLVATLNAAGYRELIDLYLAPYDWRLPLGPSNEDSVLDGTIEISADAIIDDTFDFGVDYLGRVLRQAAENWFERHGQPLTHVHIIAHSMGGLLSRTYMQSPAYGGSFRSTKLDRDLRLPLVSDLTMLGVPNRGGAGAWNGWHNNFAADFAYRLVMSKVIHHAWEKLHAGRMIEGPGDPITLDSINHSAGHNDQLLGEEQLKFLRLWGLGLRDLNPTYAFNLGGFDIDDDAENWLLRDLNHDVNRDGNLLVSRSDFLSRVARTTLYYGASLTTATFVASRVGDPPELELFDEIVRFTDAFARSPRDSEVWYEDFLVDHNGDGTVSLPSLEEPFVGDDRVRLVPFCSDGTNCRSAIGSPVGQADFDSSGAVGHIELVSNVDAQKMILNTLDHNLNTADISTGRLLGTFGGIGLLLKSVLRNVILDPVEGFVVDTRGRRLGYNEVTGALQEIPGSVWIGKRDGIGWIGGDVDGPLELELTGIGEEHYVQVTTVGPGGINGVEDRGRLRIGQSHTMAIPDPVPRPGDFNGDDSVDSDDIDLLCRGIRSGDNAFDLTGDNVTNVSDLDFLVKSILNTTRGDANLDGIFNSGDLVQVFVSGQYEDGIAMNSGWAQGDWNCDQDFSTGDLVAAFQAGGYVAAARSHSVSLERISIKYAAAARTGMFVKTEDVELSPKMADVPAPRILQRRRTSSLVARDLVFAEDPSSRFDLHSGVSELLNRANDLCESDKWFDLEADLINE